MVTSILLLSTALTAGQLSERGEWQLSPRLAPGMELVYAGTYVEEKLSPNVNYQRRYQLDALLYVLESKTRQWEVAFLTSLTLRDPGRDTQPGARQQPASVRLELASVDAEGRLQGAGPIPLSGPATVECGMVVETPVGRIARDQIWYVSEEGRTPRTWQAVGTEACNGITCVKLQANQQSDDWDRPRADHAAWRRRDTVWLMPQVGVAQKVERVIERRDPSHRDPSQRATVRYQLDSRITYPGQLREDRREVILKVKRLQDDARPLLAHPAQYPAQIETLMHKVARCLESQAPTPYRKAMLTLQGRLEIARHGETPPESNQEEAPFNTTTTVGQRVPDFIVASITGKDPVRMSRLLGRPVFVFFYKPGEETGKEVLRFAVGLQREYGDHVGIMAMAVTADLSLARKQHEEMRLPFAVLDGQALHLTFGVTFTPRLLVLDSEGMVRRAVTGWGSETPGEIAAEIARCLRN